MLTVRTAGETHGPALVSIVEGVPAGLSITREDIDRQLARRQAGYGRGGRMQIEKDAVEILSGVRFGKTLGGPVALLIRNLDWENWRERMAREPGGEGVAALSTARPGHADLGGCLKYGHDDVRNVLERASARETAARVAGAAVARLLLRELGAEVAGQVLSIADVRVADGIAGRWECARRAEENELRMADPDAAAAAARRIDLAREAGTSVGGVVEVIVRGVPPGLGSYVSWDRRLDGRLAAAVMSIPAVKGVEIGDGFPQASRTGDAVHDEVFPGGNPENRLLGNVVLPFRRETNRAGGLEGGMSNGEPVVVRAAMKPIPTQARPLRTVAVRSWEATEAHRERSDVCAVPACSVVAEGMVAIVLAGAFQEKFGGDSVSEIQYNYRRYLGEIGCR